MKFAKYFLWASFSLSAAMPASAANYMITISGTFIRDPAAQSFFGNDGASSLVPFNLSFTIESTSTRYVPAGNIYSPGLFMKNDSYLFNKSDIRKLQF